MMKAKAEVVDKYLFEKVIAAIMPVHFVQCGLCKAITVDAKELARALDSLHDYCDNADGDFSDFASEFLSEIIESAPEEFGSFEEFEKWEVANERRAYHFLDTNNYGYEIYGKYDEVVIFNDPACHCFNKDKIGYAITISY